MDTSVVFEQVRILIVLLIVIAGLTEAFLEFIAPGMKWIKNLPVKTSVNLVLGALVGVLIAWLMKIRIENYLSFLPVIMPEVASYVIIGIAAGAGGSRFWHSVLNFIIKLTAVTNTAITQIQTLTPPKPPVPPLSN